MIEEPEGWWEAVTANHDTLDPKYEDLDWTYQRWLDEEFDSWFERESRKILEYESYFNAEADPGWPPQDS